ncbi:MAG: hydroxyacylglutathione hydrolase [Pseudomonadota bacterium]
MAAFEFHQFPCRDDNYGVLVHDPASGQTASIDAPSASAVDHALEQHGWQLTHILTTHKHIDHVEGNLELKGKYNCVIIGPEAEAADIPGIDETVSHEQRIEFGEAPVEIIATPGHTLGQIAYHFPLSRTVFAADALFALGCGRIFEGTPQQMWTALSRLAALPPETVVYAGHEYTLANAKFAMTIEPGNQALVERIEQIEKLRADDLPTLPTTIATELATNPFLRPHSAEIRQRLDMADATDEEVFTEVRRLKDNA